MSHWDDVEKSLIASGFYTKEERRRKRIDKMIDESEAYRQKQEALTSDEHTTETK